MMKLGFYYHIVVYKDDNNRIYLPAYLGLFVDELAKNAEKLIYFAFTTSEKTLEQDCCLIQKNIELIDLGSKPNFPSLVVFGGLLLNKFKKKAGHCDKILVRAPSPLAPHFYFQFRKLTNINYLMVGDYLEGIKHQNFNVFKQGIINSFTYINEFLQSKAIKKSGCIVNSIPLKTKYERINPHVTLVKTTTLTKADFFHREDTCSDPDNIKLLFVGRIEKAKGMDELVQAFKLLRENNYPVMLHLAGWETEDAKKYFQKLNESPITANFWQYHGLLGGQNLFNLYRSSDILVLPSHHEGFPRVIWEAMASSLPVISTKVGSIPQNLEHGVNSLLVEPKNQNKLFDSLIVIISDKSLRQQLIKNASILVQDCLMNIQVKKIIDYINE